MDSLLLLLFACAGALQSGAGPLEVGDVLVLALVAFLVMRRYGGLQ